MIARTRFAGVLGCNPHSRTAPRKHFSTLRQPGQERRRQLVASAARLAAGLRLSDQGRTRRRQDTLPDHLLRDIGLL
jgi:uncharacterized protein YjiS (DUF1127 family)